MATKKVAICIYGDGRITASPKFNEIDSWCEFIGYKIVDVYETDGRTVLALEKEGKV